ncbi:SLBB domain-containing protein [bacterium]|nr:SLBB domain-containing protein [bacterium]
MPKFMSWLVPLLLVCTVLHAQPPAPVEPPPPPVAAEPERPEQAKSPQVLFEGLPRFGASLFTTVTATDQGVVPAPPAGTPRQGAMNRAATTPVANLPVPPNYLLGPGDTLDLSVWARDFEQVKQTVTITPEGFVILPQVGRVTASGQTIEQLRQTLAQQYTRFFTDPKVTLVVSEQRTIEVFVTGDATRPGKYTLAGMATVLSALYAAGGPSEIGSYRKIRLNRVGRAAVEIDLYDYLLTGQREADVVLAPGDSLFIPPVSAEVGLIGEVRRPARYEVKDALTVGQALALAGGMKPSAYAPLVHLWRGEKRADWILSTLDCGDPNGAALKRPLQDGDLLIVKSILARGDNTIELMGAVKRPGYYPWTPDATVSSLLRSAEGLAWNAHMATGLLRRMDYDRHYTLIPFNVSEQMYGDNPTPIPLQPKDEVEILAQQAVEPAQEIKIDGAVAHPGTYPFAIKMRVSQLVLLAGDVLPEAYLGRADLLRLTPDQSYQIIAVDLKAALQGDGARDLELARGDILKIATQADALPAPEVQITGYVRRPGKYPRREGMKVSDLIFAAGGLKPGAGPDVEVIPGRFEGMPQPVRLALTGTPDAFRIEPDMALGEGDSVSIIGRGEFQGQADVVVLQGRVEHPGSFALRRDRDHAYTVMDLLRDSGGLLPDANPNGMVIYRHRDLTTDPAQIEDLSRILAATNRESGQAPMQVGQGTQAAAMSTSIAQNLSTLISPGAASIVLPPRPVRSEDMVTAIPVAGKELLASNGKAGNIELEAGDNLVVPRRMNTVTVLGAVPRSGAVPYVEAYRCRQYIAEAGGLREDAAQKRLVVIHPNGAAAPIGLKDAIEPGDVIVVPTTYIVRTVHTENSWQQWLRSIITIATAALVF